MGFWIAARVLHILVCAAAVLQFSMLARSLLRQAPYAVLANTRCFSIKIWKQAFGCRADDRFDAVVHHRMQILRLRNAERATAWVSPSFGFVLLCYIVWGEIQGTDQDNTVGGFVASFNYFMLHLIGALAYIGCVAVNVNLLTLKSAYMHCIYALVMTTMTIRLLFTTDDARFFVLAPIRVIIRMVGGLMLLDHRKAIVWNVPLSLAICFMFKYNAGAMKPDMLVEGSGTLWIAQEVFALCATIFTLYCAEWWQLACVHATVTARSIESARQAVHALLSVFCDSVVHLGSDQNILRPAPELAHLLCISKDHRARGKGATVDAINSLVGDKLVNHIENKDRQRFVEFIALTQQATESVQQAKHESHGAQPEDILETNTVWAGGPPGAIHLHMNSPFRSAFPVDLFAVHFRDLKGQVGHLIGIRDAGSHGNVPDLAASAVRDSNDVARMVTRGAQARNRSYPSSSTSSVSLKVADSFEISRVACEFDAGSPELHVSACNIRLTPVKRHAIVDASAAASQQQQTQNAAVPDGADSGIVRGRRRCPGLFDLVASPTPHELQRWIQSEANSLASGNPPSELEGVHVHVCQPLLSMNVALVARYASVDFMPEESDEEDKDTQAQQQQQKQQQQQVHQQQVPQQQVHQQVQRLNLPMLLMLDGLVTQRHGRHRSRSSNSSVSSRSSRASRGPPMPAIEEHPTGQEDLEEQWLSTGRQEHCQSAAATAEMVVSIGPSVKAPHASTIMRL